MAGETYTKYQGSNGMNIGLRGRRAAISVVDDYAQTYHKVDRRINVRELTDRRVNFYREL
jgi:hypothetical protein